MDDSTASRLSRQVLQTLESLHGAGVLQLPKAKPRPKGLVAPAEPATEVEPMAVAPRPVTEPAPKSEDFGQQQIAPVGRLFQADTEIPREQPNEVSAAATLEVLRDEVAACVKCHELACTRTQTVFGVGNPQARLCFLGEAPGADEDRLGEPFVGRGGQLLDKIMEACRLKREDVFILNVIKCRPPGNRNPTPGEAENCRPYLLRQLELIKPEFICCLGTVAAQNLLRTTESIGRLRGQLHDYQGIKVVCTYHPAYLLRNPSAKKYTWDDMKFLMREMGTPVD